MSLSKVLDFGNSPKQLFFISIGYASLISAAKVTGNYRRYVKDQKFAHKALVSYLFGFLILAYAGILEENLAQLHPLTLGNPLEFLFISVVTYLINTTLFVVIFTANDYWDNRRENKKSKSQVRFEFINLF